MERNSGSRMEGEAAGGGLFGPYGLGVVSTLVIVSVLYGLAVCGVLILLKAPAAPQLSAQPGDGSVTLNWTGDLRHMNVGGWHLQKREIGREYGDWEVVEPVSDPRRRTLTHVIGNLTNGWTYVFRVRVESRLDGRGAPSNEASATPSALNAMSERLARLEGRILDPYCEGPRRDIGTVTFARNSADIDSSAEGEVQSIVGKLKLYGQDGLVLVVGRASADGDAVHNMGLSERRANAVIERLRERLAAWRGRLAFREVVEGENYGQRESDRSAQVFLCRGW